ncbi:hypothetical protein [Streptomyces sp. NPDC006638]|uniref:hypothetical protein n=1 Tax=Streptomyces sp. NPDC006638 TaxID=3157183 RepID=UPI0033AE03AF
MFRVRQTKTSGRWYPVGKIWGPYREKVDAEQRVGTLRDRQCDGDIEEGEFGAPCGAHLADAGPGPGGVYVDA